MSELSILKKRADFLRAARGLKRRAPSFVLQARARDVDGEGGNGIRVGFTCSKKVGNAVARNRAKRRLREAARHILPAQGKAGWDYVLIGLNTLTAERPWALLLSDLDRALQEIHAQRSSSPSGGP